jgi:hypothetical protein
MDPAALKLILDAFNRRFDEMEARLDRRFSPPPMTEPRDAGEDDLSALLLAQAPSTKEAVVVTSDPSSLAPMQPQAGEAGSFESEAAAPPSSVNEPYRDDAAGADHLGTGVDLVLQQAAKVLAPLAYHAVASSATRLAIMVSDVTWPGALTVYAELRDEHAMEARLHPSRTLALDELPQVLHSRCSTFGPIHIERATASVSTTPAPLRLRRPRRAPPRPPWLRRPRCSSWAS